MARGRIAWGSILNGLALVEPACSHGSPKHGSSLLKKASGCLQCIHAQSFCMIVIMKCKCAFILPFFFSSYEVRDIIMTGRELVNLITDEN